MKRKIIVMLLLAALTISMLTGCANEDTKETSSDSLTDSQEDTFIMAIEYMPDSLLPSTDSDDYTTMLRPIYEPLFAETKEGFEYYLADSVDISEDALTYTIHVNQDAVWSDGEPVTVQDILFTLDYQNLLYGGAYTTVNGVDPIFNEIDDKTLEIVLPEPYANYSMLLSRVLLMPSHEFDGDASKVDDSGYFNSTEMVTSGAYVVSEINDDSIVYTVRDDYNRGTPDVKKVILKTIGTGSSKQVAFENGEISYMRVTSAEELEKYENDTENYNIYSVSEARLNYLQINPYGPANLSEDARKAIFLALDVNEIIEVAYGSDKLAVAANSLLTPDQSLYNPDCEGYKQDLETAKKLAESSGLSGTTLTYIYNADRPNMEMVATVVQQQLAEIGVTLSVEGLDSTTFFEEFFALLYESGLENTWDLGSNGWDSERGTNLGQSYDYFNDPMDSYGFSQEIKDLTVKTNSMSDPEEAKACAYELQDKALEEYWEFPLTYTNYVMVSQKNISGLDQTNIVPEFIDYMDIKVD